MKYSVGFNTENKLESPYTMDNHVHFNTLKESRTFIKILKDANFIKDQYVITKNTRNGFSQVI